jgi:release factor glutamine methyltransferase
MATALRQAVECLADRSTSPRLDAEVLLTFVLRTARTDLYAWTDRPLSVEEQAHYRSLIQRRAEGEPVAYITGQREFWSMSLEVTQDTLIPRPETETLVELALSRIPVTARWQVADLGTGCGAIALAIANERPLCRVIAVDISAPALEVARRNVERLGLGNIELRQGSWLRPLGNEPFHIIVSNPPYVAADDSHLDAGDLRFEPRVALTPGEDALAAVRHLVSTAGAHLAGGGCLILEHGFDQGHEARALLASQGYREVHSRLDLAGHERVTEGRRPGEPS